MKIIDHQAVLGRRRLQSDGVLSKSPSAAAFSRLMFSGQASDANFGPTDYVSSRKRRSQQSAKQVVGNIRRETWSYLRRKEKLLEIRAIADNQAKN